MRDVRQEKMKRLRPEAIIVALVGLCIVAGVIAIISAEIFHLVMLKTIAVILFSLGVSVAFLPLLLLFSMLLYEKILKKKPRP